MQISKPTSHIQPKELTIETLENEKVAQNNGGQRHNSLLLNVINIYAQTNATNMHQVLLRLFLFVSSCHIFWKIFVAAETKLTEYFKQNPRK